MILVLDNRDSYTYNLVQLLQARTRREVCVVGADEGERALALLAEGNVDGVVISPGPGHPDIAGDFAASGALIDAVLSSAPTVPLLGVCLGHQGLARRFGYEVVAAPEPKHGWISALQHAGSGIFRGVPQGTRVTRYHSLAIVPGDEPSPRLRVTARSEDGVIQAFAIEGAPWFGVQFHPESIASEHGALMLERFLEVVDSTARATDDAVPNASPAAASPGVGEKAMGETGAASGDAPPLTGAVLYVATRHVDIASLPIDARGAARAIARRALHRGRGSFWLESAIADGEHARWSVLGDASDAAGDGRPGVLRFREGTLTIDSWAAGAPGPSEPQEPLGDIPASRTVPCDDPFAALADELAGLRVEGGEGLPFRGGLVGFLGYELGLRELGVPRELVAPSTTPDACWIRPARFVVIDHARSRLTVAVVSFDAVAAEESVGRELGRVRDTFEAEAEVAHAAKLVGGQERDCPSHPIAAEVPARLGEWRDDRAAYARKIAECQRALQSGDSYELCLTTSFDLDDDIEVDPLELFEDLIAQHPAPYAALLEINDGGDPLAIVSASPERFLRGRGNHFDTKPIKGTARRDPDPAHDRALAEALADDPKTFAENLMIVDLLRNDLGRVCRPGSVEVPALMQVESYASLHQLVSTVRGIAREGVGAVEVARALFPGGSMTGAPKRRSVEILAQLEGHARGVYSGVLGMFSADGDTELSIVIRAAVRSAGRWSIGAGGAIVLASEADAEYDEVELKARALQRAIGRVARHERPAPPHPPSSHRVTGAAPGGATARGRA